MLAFAGEGTAEDSLRVGGLLGDGMVVQQGRELTVTGSARPGAEVSAELAGESVRTRAEADGHWTVRLNPPPVGGPYELTLRSGEALQQFTDILVGEVWLCSGQSNMEWEVRQSNAAGEPLDEEVAAHVRLFEFPRRTATQPKDAVGGEWRKVNPETLAGFSAVGWHFGREISTTQGVPVGLIQAAWGGTRIEAWMPKESLRPFPELASFLKGNPDLLRGVGETELEELVAHARAVRFLDDPGNRGILFGYHLSGYDDAGWPTMRVPGMLEDRGVFLDGAIWFRREVRLPEAWQGRTLVLELGRIDDFDTTYVNNVQVGHTSKGNPEDAHRVKRTYEVDGELWHFGDTGNTVAVRVFDHYGKGGFAGPGLAMRLYPSGSEEEAISLAGQWKWKTEMSTPDYRHDGASLRNYLPSNPNRPAVLYNGMIHPLRNFPIRGVIWYQGESNSGEPELYSRLFPELIRSWRSLWEEPGMPFLYAQLANYKKRQSEPAEGGWALIREAQQAALDLPLTAEAVIIDAGEADDIHPRDKKTVGQRLALQARALVYGEDIPHSSPYLRSFAILGDAVYLRLEPTYGELATSDGGEPAGFAIRGQSGKWYWGEARIDGSDTIVVRHPSVNNPAAVRYGWANNPVGNVVNGAGLPLSPFRTDAERAGSAMPN